MNSGGGGRRTARHAVNVPNGWLGCRLILRVGSDHWINLSTEVRKNDGVDPLTEHMLHVNGGGSTSSSDRRCADSHDHKFHCCHSLSHTNRQAANIYIYKLTPVGRPGTSVGAPVTPVPSSRSYSLNSRSTAAVGEETGSLMAAAETARAAMMTDWKDFIVVVVYKKE